MLELGLFILEIKKLMTSGIYNPIFNIVIIDLWGKGISFWLGEAWVII
jgi:hypothetical protein